MVNTIVTFGNNRLSSNTPLPIVISNPDKSFFQRRLYLIVGIIILIVILLPNIFAISNDHDDFAYHLLFIVHASFLSLFFISTMIYRDIGDGITTISGLVLFAGYKTIHYLIRYRYCRMNFRKDFLISTIQLTILFIFVISYILWTYLLIRKKYQETITTKTKDIQIKQKRIFYSLISLNLMLIISSFILHIRNQENFGLYQILILSIGIPIALVWYTVGILMSMYQNCLCISSFYFLSLIQPFHLIYFIFQTLDEWQNFSLENEIHQFLPLLIIIFLCISINFLVHLFTTIIACWMLSKTDKTIVNTRWMLTSV